MRGKSIDEPKISKSIVFFVFFTENPTPNSSGINKPIYTERYSETNRYHLNNFGIEHFNSIVTYSSKSYAKNYKASEETAVHQSQSSIRRIFNHPCI